jgi:hypothetical protein
LPYANSIAANFITAVIQNLWLIRFMGYSFCYFVHRIRIHIEEISNAGKTQGSGNSNLKKYGAKRNRITARPRDTRPCISIRYLIGMPNFFLSANSYFLIRKENDEASMLIHSIPMQ